MSKLLTFATATAVSLSSLIALPLTQASANAENNSAIRIVEPGTSLDLAYAQLLAQSQGLEVCSDSENALNIQETPTQETPTQETSIEGIQLEANNSAVETEEPIQEQDSGPELVTEVENDSPVSNTDTDFTEVPLSDSDETLTGDADQVQPDQIQPDQNCVPVEQQDRMGLLTQASDSESGTGNPIQVVDFTSIRPAGSDRRSFETPTGSLDASAAQILSNDAGATVQVVTVERDADGTLDVVVTDEIAKSEAAAVIQDAQADPATVAVSVSQPVTINARRDSPSLTPYSFPTTTSTDPSRAYQRLNNDGAGTSSVWYSKGAMSQAEYVWKFSRGAGITVAVIDTGVDGTHEDLAGQVLPGFDFVSGATGPTAGWNDLNTHGTHVAGIISAKDNNAVGIAGLAPDAKILPVRVLGADGSGSSAAVAQGIIAAVDAGAEVLNLSLGSPMPDAALEAAVAYAVSNDVTVVAAGGNLNMPGWITLNGQNYPASYPGVIGVASTNSDCGGVGGAHIDVSANGCNIRSTIPGGYANYSGTSMASPQVAAEAALFLAQGKSKAQTEALILGNTYLIWSILAFDCVEHPTVTICNPIGIDETKTMLIRGTGTISPTDAMLQSMGLSSYTLGNVYSATSSPAPAPSIGGGAPASGSGGGSGAPASGGGGGAPASGGSLQEITGLRPAAGPLTGGNTVAVIGYGLSGVTSATVGGKSASFTIINDAHVDVVIPQGSSLGPVDVALNISAARGRAFAGGGYVYRELPPMPASDTPGPTVTIPEIAPTPNVPLVKVISAVNGRINISVPEDSKTIVIQKRSKGKWSNMRSLPVNKPTYSLRVKSGTYRAVVTTETDRTVSRAIKVVAK